MSRHQGSGWIAAVAALLVSLLPAPGAAASRRYAARMEVALAARDVRVLDERQCVARRVEPGDLQIVAGNRRLPTRLRRRPPQPIRLLVLVDASFSMVGRRLELAAAAARRLLERLGREGGHEVALAVFDEGVYWLTPGGFSSDPCPAAEGLVALEAGGGTALWRALDAALTVIDNDPSERITAVVAITDGEDNTDREDAIGARVRTRSRALGVPLFAIAIPPRSEVMLVDEGDGNVAEVACGGSDWTPRGLGRERERLLRACRTSGGAMYTPRKSRVFEAVDFVLTQIRDVHQVEAELPPDLIGAEVEVAATRRGLSVLGQKGEARRGVH